MDKNGNGNGGVWKLVATSAVSVIVAGGSSYMAFGSGVSREEMMEAFDRHSGRAHESAATRDEVGDLRDDLRALAATARAIDVQVGELAVDLARLTGPSDSH